MRDGSLYEQLAAVQHDIWSHWMRYLLGTKARRLSAVDGDGDRVVLGADVVHWWRQINTPYAELSEQEKTSDREQVDRFWHLVCPTPCDLVALREWLDDEMEKEAELLLRVHNPLREHRLSTLREVRDHLPSGASCRDREDDDD